MSIENYRKQASRKTTHTHTAQMSTFASNFRDLKKRNNHRNHCFFTAAQLWNSLQTASTDCLNKQLKLTGSTKIKSADK